MKRLFINRGSIFLVTILFTVVFIVIGALLPLLATIAVQSNESSDKLYDRYTYESLVKIMSKQLIEELPTATATFQYNPIYTSEESQLKLYEGLSNTFTDSSDLWVYCSLIPTEVCAKKIKTIVKFNTTFTASENIDLLTGGSLAVPATIEITLGNMSYSVTVENLRLFFSFRSGRVVCQYDVSQALLTNENLEIRRIYA